VHDEDRPKKPTSGYQLFCNANFQQLRESNPGMKQTDVYVMLGKMWSDAAGGTERESYEAQHRTFKAEYDLKMTEYKMVGCD
jgi:hypothetical protein